tara:strand:- start:295 stop:504 length:210 start_codon:yes stop_codon:yes gene_type:complete
MATAETPEHPVYALVEKSLEAQNSKLSSVIGWQPMVKLRFSSITTFRKSASKRFSFAILQKICDHVICC